MKIAITGADGRIGRVLTQHWKDAHEITTIGIEHDLRAPGPWEAQLAGAETIVHLAAVLADIHDFNLLKDNLAMVLNVVGAAANGHRIVYASSMWALHEQISIGPRGNYYSASKLAGEAIVAGWSHTHDRPAVSLRIGKFGGPDELRHEMLRVDETTLLWWFDRAIAHDEPVHATWLTVGRSNDLVQWTETGRGA
jgi:nucleoside-diphosphate-sugar epimerase